MSEYVVLVNERDEAVGIAEKLQTHIEGRLHRAVSVFIFNGRGELLLQRRHPAKYHSGGLWSNTCCTHPHPGESVAAAAQRRLIEEMGIGCELHRLFGLVYRSELDGGLIEHEYDHVFTGQYDGMPVPNSLEVDGWHWVEPTHILEAMRRQPHAYTSWFRLLLRRVLETHASQPV